MLVVWMQSPLCGCSVCCVDTVLAGWIECWLCGCSLRCVDAVWILVPKCFTVFPGSHVMLISGADPGFCHRGWG